MEMMRKLIILICSIMFGVSCVIEKNNASSNDPIVQPAPEPTPDIPKVADTLKRMSPDFYKSPYYFSQSTYVKSCDFHSYGSDGAIFRVESRTIDQANLVMIHEVYFTDRCDGLYFYANYHLFYSAQYELTINGEEDGLIHFEYKFSNSYLYTETDDGLRLFMELEEAKKCDVNLAYTSYQSFEVANSAHCFLEQDPDKVLKGHAYIDEKNYSVLFNKAGELTLQEERPWNFYYFDYYFTDILDIETNEHHFYFTQGGGKYEGMSAYFNPVGYNDYYDFSDYPRGKYIQEYVNYQDNPDELLFKIVYDVTLNFQYSYTRDDIDRPIYDVRLDFSNAFLTPLSDAGLSYLNDSNFCETAGISAGETVDVLGRSSCSHKSKGFEYTYFFFQPEYNSFILGIYNEHYSTRDGSSPEQRYIIEDSYNREYMLMY